MPYAYYFQIAASPTLPKLQAQRVARIEELAKQYDLICHSETHGDIVTLQVETDDSSSSLLFKLAAESPLFEISN